MTNLVSLHDQSIARLRRLRDAQIVFIASLFFFKEEETREFRRCSPSVWEARTQDKIYDDDELYIIYILQERVESRVFIKKQIGKMTLDPVPPINCCRRIPLQPPRPGVSAELPPVTHRERTLIT